MRSCQAQNQKLLCERPEPLALHTHLLTTLLTNLLPVQVREYGAQIRATCTVDGGMEGRQMGTAFRMLAGGLPGGLSACLQMARLAVHLPHTLVLFSRGQAFHFLSCRS